MEVLISAEKVCMCTHTNLKHQRSYNERRLIFSEYQRHQCNLFPFLYLCKEVL